MDKSKGETATVYLGRERLAGMRKRATELGYRSLSEFVTALYESGQASAPTAADARAKFSLNSVRQKTARKARAGKWVGA